MKWRKNRTGEIVDPIAHSLEMIKRYPKKWDDLRIYVGCDSQNRRFSASYVTVIAYRMGDRGADFIYCRENVPKFKGTDNSSAKIQRLRGEVYRALDIAVKLRDGGVPVHCVDLDLNAKMGTGSNMLTAEGKGLLVGMGFNCTVKPEEQVASRAADHLVRR